MGRGRKKEDMEDSVLCNSFPTMARRHAHVFPSQWLYSLAQKANLGYKIVPEDLALLRKERQ